MSSWLPQRLWYAWKQWPTRPERSPWNLFRLPARLPACSALTSMHILTSQIFNPRSRSELYDRRHFPKAGSWSGLCIWWSNFQQERSSTCQVNFFFFFFLTNGFWSPSPCFYTGLWQASPWESSQYFTLAWKLLQEARQPLGNIGSFWWRNFINRGRTLNTLIDIFGALKVPNMWGAATRSFHSSSYQSGMSTTALSQSGRRLFWKRVKGRVNYFSF